MTEDLTAPVWAVLAVAVLALVVVTVVLVSVKNARRRTDAALAAAREDAEALQAQVAAIEQRLSERPAAPTQVEAREYVITRLGDWGDGSDDDVDISGDETVRVPAVPVVPAPLFADLVLREGVVQAASLAAGLRRALAPETRHRIRFEMRREVKRARKQRRADVRQARRDVEARQRTKVSV